MLEHVRRLVKRRDEDGASAVEYGLLIAAIAALIVIVVFVLGGIIKNVFNNTCDTIASNASAGTTDCAS